MSGSIFKDCQIYIVPNGLFGKRMKLFKEQVKKHGGEIVSDTKIILPTHVVVEESYLTNPNQVRNVLKAVELNYDDLKADIVGTLWLSKCLKEKNILDTEPFKYKRKADVSHQMMEGETSSKTQRTQIVLNDRSTDFSNNELTVNETVIEEFQKLAEAYRVIGDRWRTLAYDKAIASLKSWRKPISDVNDLKLLPHISAKMLDKISEIIENGCCEKVDEICSDERTQVLTIFDKVWGAGEKTTNIWYQKGYRTLEDLRTKANLTWQQKLGLEYYNEIQEPIPREEVEQIVNYVKRAAQEVDSTLQVMACGSFRRGKLMCGDIDVLVLARSLTNVLHKIMAKLKNENFLIADLSVGKSETSTKYLGLCKLPGESSKIRRLDIFIVSGNMVGCALVHYTGSALFNRGIRRYAWKLNMKLTEYKLICNGQVLPTPTEESVFAHLQLEYKRPEDRENFEASTVNHVS